MTPIPQPDYFILEEGIESPRDGSINWRAFDYFSNLTAAKQTIKGAAGRWRIVEAKVVWEKSQ